MTKEHQTDPLDALGAIYEKMYEHVANDFHRLKDKNKPNLSELIEDAKVKVIELENVTEQDADKLTGWLRRDIEATASYFSEKENELKDWLGFEASELESAALDLVLKTADKTTLELLALKEKASHSYHAGEITGPGTLICDTCLHKQQYYKPGPIQPCYKCHDKKFHR